MRIVRRKFFCGQTVALMLLAQTAFASGYMDIDVFGYSESVPIASAIGKWDGPFNSGTSVLSHDKIEFGVVSGHWSIGIFKRYDYNLEFSEDTSEFYYKINNKIDLEPGQVYDLDIVIRHAYSEGVRLGRHYSLSPNLTFNISASYLHGIDLTDGYIKGSATALASNDYDFQFDVSYLYSKDTLFDRGVTKPSGDGLGFDFYLDWKITDKYFTTLEINDLYSFIRWHDAPYTTAASSSDTKTYDDDGFVVYQPVISGVESNRDFTQRLPRRGEWLGGYKMDERYSLIAALNFYENLQFYQLGGNYRIEYGATVQLTYVTNIHAVSMQFVGKQLSMSILTDSLSFKDVRVLGLMLSYNQHW